MLDTIDSNQTWEQLKMETENINFKLDITGEGWDGHYPTCVVRINNEVMWKGPAEGKTEVSFDAELEENADHELSIAYVDRNDSRDTKRDADNNITANKFIEINSINVDNIELEPYHIVYCTGVTTYTDASYAQCNATDPENYPLVFTNNTHLGTEGRYTLKLTSPIYMWLLENM